jgi:hypothetical protein
MTALPKPDQWIIRKLSEQEMAEEIERHIEYYDPKTDKSVHLPMQFVRHYMRRYDGALPTIVAIATLPIVLADGHILAMAGLDRLRGIEFHIPPEVLAITPKPEDCTEDAVERAMAFLTDEWLCDVSTDYAGKCTIIAAALTIIERSLLPDRPCFFITAGRRGGGKTTLIAMMIMGTTGVRPSTAAWTPNEEERRKALLSYFMQGNAYILWDNIPRGLQISCPHIERSCTAAYYMDRKLGVSEVVATAASTIHLFTGNNIGPKGDLASRSLRIRIEVDRPDPENRTFQHPDPIGWTEGMRAEILAAFYTLLLGNPMLKTPRDAPCKTRFKMWWRVVGSAVEHAARLANPDREIDFQKLFAEQEETDEESASLADALDIMHRRWPVTFAAADVAKVINSWDGMPDQDSATLRDYLYPTLPPSQTVTPKSVGRLLIKQTDNMVSHGEQRLVLRSHKASEGKSTTFFVSAS